MKLDSTEFEFDKSTLLTINFVSADIMHGMSIASLEFEINASRPAPSEDFGVVSTESITLPSDDEIIKTEASIRVFIERNKGALK